jgi:iron complex transport system substrate-binding protein
MTTPTSSTHRLPRTSRRTFAAGTGLATIGLAEGNSLLAQSTPAAEGTRVLSHAMGETEIPANPQRVLVLDGPVLDACFALGVTPVGATTGVEGAPFPAYLSEGTEGIVNVGVIGEPDLEAIASLEPDLIIGIQFRHEGIYDQLAGIAPAVLSPFDSTGWRDGFLFYADALNKAEQAPAIVQAFDDKAAALAVDLGETLDTSTVAVVRILSGQVRSYQAGAFCGIVLEAVGLPRPESQQNPDEVWLEQSMEQINELESTVIFVTMWDEATDEDLADLFANPLWGTLTAVQQNRVYLVPDEYWMVAIGYLAADLILDDLRTYLVDGGEPVGLG